MIGVGEGVTVVELCDKCRRVASLWWSYVITVGEWRHCSGAM